MGSSKVWQPSSFAIFTYLAASLVAILLLTSCSGKPADLDDNYETVKKSARIEAQIEERSKSVPEKQSDEPVALTLPNCDAIDLSVWQEPNDLVVEETVGFTYEAGGPVARETITGAIQNVECYVYLPNSGFGMKVFTAELSDSSRENFVQALQDSNYVESTYQGIQTFSYVDTSEAGPMGGYSLTLYSFLGNILIGQSNGDMGEAPNNPVPSVFMDQLISATLVLNPQLDD